jgi:glycosyltransferase involved in cell wall biosynthesis
MSSLGFSGQTSGRASVGRSGPIGDGKASVTAIVLTLNEAREIGDCLAQIPGDLPKLVVDSGSTDETVAIARAAGAKVVTRSWSGFASQRNFALSSCGVTTDWVLFVDADERYPAAFFDWMRQALALETQIDAFNVPSRLVLDKVLLRRAPGYPILHPRLVRRTVTFLPNHAGHGEMLSPCRTGLAPIGYDHYFQAGDLAPWLRKHVSLAEFEAGGSAAPTTRRGRLARLFPAGPLRAAARFVYHDVVCQGFRDGKAGFRYALMYAWYELTVYLIGVSQCAQD